MTGIELIAQERKRQIEQEGFSLELDREYPPKLLARAAYCYLWYVLLGEFVSHLWPWPRSWWKPSDDPVRNLVKAGALIAAEIDRLKGGT